MKRKTFGVLNTRLNNFKYIEDSFYNFCLAYFDDQVEGKYVAISFPKVPVNLAMGNLQDMAIFIIDYLVISYLRIFIAKTPFYKVRDYNNDYLCMLLRRRLSTSAHAQYLLKRVLVYKLAQIYINHLKSTNMDIFTSVHLNEVKDLLNEFWFYFYDDLPQRGFLDYKVTTPMVYIYLKNFGYSNPDFLELVIRYVFRVLFVRKILFSKEPSCPQKAGHYWKMGDDVFSNTGLINQGCPIIKLVIISSLHPKAMKKPYICFCYYLN